MAGAGGEDGGDFRVAGRAGRRLLAATEVAEKGDHRAVCQHERERRPVAGVVVVVRSVGRNGDDRAGPAVISRGAVAAKTPNLISPLSTRKTSGEACACGGVPEPGGTSNSRTARSVPGTLPMKRRRSRTTQRLSASEGAVAVMDVLMVGYSFLSEDFRTASVSTVSAQAAAAPASRPLTPA